jgi:hypothetical protein
MFMLQQPAGVTNSLSAEVQCLFPLLLPNWAAKGDILTYDTAPARLPVGADGQVLKANSATATGLEWAVESGVAAVPVEDDGIQILAAPTALNFAGAGVTVTDDSGEALITIPGGSTSPLTTKGDIYTFDTDNQRLPIGTNGQFLAVDNTEATGLKWVDDVVISSIDGENAIITAETTSSFNKSSSTVYSQFLPSSGSLQYTAVKSGEHKIQLNYMYLINGYSSIVNFVSRVSFDDTVNPVIYAGGNNKWRYRASGNTSYLLASYQDVVTLQAGQTYNVVAEVAQESSVSTNMLIPESSGVGQQPTITITIPGGSLSTLTTKGDLYAFDTDNTRLPVGTDGQVLRANSATATGLEWSTESGVAAVPVEDDGTQIVASPTVLNFIGDGVTVTDVGGEASIAIPGGSISPLTTKGDLYTYDTDSQRLGVGTNGQVLTADSAEATGLKWANTAISSPLTTKGDIYTFDTDNNRLAIGTNGQVLTVDSAEATGMKWADAAGGGGFDREEEFISSNNGTETFTISTSAAVNTNTPSGYSVRVYVNGLKHKYSSSTPGSREFDIVSATQIRVGGLNISDEVEIIYGV